MKRTLSLVLALVMLLGTIPVFAAEVDERIAFLEAEGLLKGNTAGDLMLENELKRQDSVVVLARLLGLEEAALAYEGEFPWEDAKADPFYFGFLAWAYEEGLYKGHSDEKFGFNETITANDFALVLWRALGYEDPAVWSDAFDAAKELGLVEGLDLEATDKLLRSDMAIMMYLALETEMAEGGKTLAEVLGVEMPTVTMVAEAVAVNKVKVTFNKAIDTASFEVFRGIVKLNISETVWNEAKTEATLTMVGQFVVDEYTVKANVNDEALTATFKVDSLQKVSKIEFLSDKAVLADNTNTKVTIAYRLLDQYGVDVTSTKSGDIQWTSTANVDSSEKASGKIHLTSAAFTLNQNVIVNALDTTTGVFASGTFVVSQMAYVNELTFGAVTPNTGSTATVLYTNNQTQFHIPVVAKDQYGNTITNATKVANDLLKLNINIDATFAVVNNALRLNLTGPSIAADATLTYVSVYNGNRFSTTFKVNEPTKVVDFNMALPSMLVAGDADKYEVPFTAFDQYGNAVTDAGTLNTSIRNSLVITAPSGVTGLTNANFEFKKDAVTGVTKLWLDMSGVNSSATNQVFLSVVTPGLKLFQTSFSVFANAMPTVVVGVTGVPTSMVSGAAVTLEAKNVTVQDQHGRTMTFDKISGYTLNVTSSSINVSLSATTMTSTGSIVMSGDAVGNSTIKIEIASVANSAYTFTASVVKASDVVTYEIADVPTMQAGTTKTLVLTGKLANGTVVKLNESVVKQVVSADTTVLVPTPDALSLTLYATPGAITTADKTVAVVVTIEGSTGPVIITKNVTVSYKLPAAVSVTVDPSVVVTDTMLNNPTDTGVTGTLLSLFTVMDQYGNKMPNNAKGVIVITNRTATAAVVTLVTPNGLTATTNAVISN